MTTLSQNIKNGQQLNASCGAGAIASGDVVSIGGPGVEAWSCATADYAAVPQAAVLAAQTSVVPSALPGSARQPVARDRLGNIYVAGTNGGGNLVAYKLSPIGVSISSAVLDATATSVNSAHLFQLQNGAYACVYARAAGALFFVVFDAALNLVAGPVSVGTEFHSTNVVYHSACPLTGGGFAVAFQTNAGTAINLATYSNAGSVVQAATSIQALAGGAAQEYLKLAQLASGNLACAFRGAMTAAGIAGTSFTIVTVGGAAVAGPVSFDTTSTAGLVEMSVLPTTFGLAVANGTNLLAGVFSNLGAQQGTTYSVGNTLNSATYPQTKLTNDGQGYWLAWFSSAANGLYLAALSAGGAVTATASALGGGTLNASTFALDAEVINGLLVALAASSATAGQYWLTVGLPDASLGIVAPYVRTQPTAFGTAAATAGSNWPRLLSGGGGLYRGTSPPAGQPTLGGLNGDFTAIFVYDQQNSTQTYVGIQKFEASAIVGTALKSVSQGQNGSPVTINPGPGEYLSNNVGGTSGTQFNHIGLTPSGTAGAMYTSGVGLTGMLNGPFTSGAASNWVTGDVKRTFSNPSNTTPQPGWLYLTAGTIGAPGSGATLRANADVQPLYSFLWNTFSNAVCPVTGGRGVSAAADFSAGKPLAMIDARGCYEAAPDNQGTVGFRGVLGHNPSAGGFPGDATLGLQAGEQAHTPTVGETAAHHHEQFGLTGVAQGGGVIQTPSGSNTADTSTTGGGDPFNVTPPTVLVYLLIKL